MGTAIQIRNLSKAFSHCKALQEVCLDVDAGEMVALIGASGSGKSTLLRHIAGFVAADAGEITVFGQAIQQDGRMSANVRRLRAGIGFVFQQFNLVGRLSVMTNVLTGLLYRTSLWRSLLMRFSTDERQQALEALVAVGIEQSAWQRAATLSGGQQQRAALARCLVQRARVILADEPIASLDPESARNVMDLLAGMNRAARLHGGGVAAPGRVRAQVLPAHGRPAPRADRLRRTLGGTDAAAARRAVWRRRAAAVRQVAGRPRAGAGPASPLARPPLAAA